MWDEKKVCQIVSIYKRGVECRGVMLLTAYKSYHISSTVCAIVVYEISQRCSSMSECHKHVSHVVLVIIDSMVVGEKKSHH